MTESHLWIAYAASIVVGVTIAKRRHRWVAVPLVLFFPIVGFLFALMLNVRCKHCGNYYKGFRFCPACGTPRNGKRKVVKSSVSVEIIDHGEDKATERQLSFIRSLGGNPVKDMTRQEASDMIDELKIQKEMMIQETARRRLAKKQSDKSASNG